MRTLNIDPDVRKGRVNHRVHDALTITSFDTRETIARPVHRLGHLFQLFAPGVKLRHAELQVPREDQMVTLKTENHLTAEVFVLLAAAQIEHDDLVHVHT